MIPPAQALNGRNSAKSKWTVSVCAGSLILAAAGLLKGLEATTHWAAMEMLAMFGAKPARQRVVRPKVEKTFISSSN